MIFRRSLYSMLLGLGIAGGSLAIGYIQVGVWYLAVVVWFIVVMGLAGEHFRWSWIPSLLLLSFTMFSVIGIWMGMWLGWPLLGLLGALASVDLANFRLRIARAMQTGADARRMEDRHLKRLGVALGFGVILYLIPWFAQFRLNFGVALVLGLIAVLGISLAINTRRRSSG